WLAKANWLANTPPVGIMIIVKVNQNINGVIGTYLLPKKNGTNCLVFAIIITANKVPSITVASSDFFITIFCAFFPSLAILGIMTSEILVITPRIIFEIRCELS